MRLGIILSVLFFSYYSSALCVVTSKANLRAGPSGSAKLKLTVGKYTPLIEHKRKGRWLNVSDLDGKKFWISSSLVSSNIDCVVVRVKKSPLHKGPGRRYPHTDMGFAFKYSPFRKLEREEAWLKLKDDHGYVHWAHEKNLWQPLMRSRLTY